jgi:hypothetical protein
MSLVLDRPVTPNGLGEAACAELLAADVVADLDALFSVPSGLVERPADRGEMGLTSTFGQVGGSIADRVNASLVPTLSVLASLTAR